MIRLIQLLVFVALTGGLSAADRPRPNVVLLMADDLAATLGCYGYPQARTPHLDSFAAGAVRFNKAYCQFPHCNPSRASLLTGMRPNTTRVTNNEDNLYHNHPGVLTLPHHFRNQGYATARCGKIFHLGVPSGLESMDDPEAWDFGTPFKSELPFPPKRESDVKIKAGKKSGLPWQEIPGADEQLVDGMFAATAIDWLNKRDESKPFFLAVGFHRPHMPLVAPAKYYDPISFGDITLPNAPADDEADIPPPARNGAVPGYAVTATPEQRRAAIRAYLACVSYIDAQAGKVLDALKTKGLLDNTIVIFTSDHGWHLGEHSLWHKRSLFEECARVPLLIRAPGIEPGVHDSPVESLDLFPTLCDLTGLPAPAQMEGRSLRPVLAAPGTKTENVAFTQARRGENAEYWGRTVRTHRWRCTEWNEGRDGIELYDHDTDPHEYTNLAQDPKHATTLKQLRELLAKKLPPIVQP